MKATKKTYKTLTNEITALKDYLNSECTAYQFLYNWRYKDEVIELINTLKLNLSTIIALNQFDITVRLTENQTRIIEIALNKEYITETYLTIQKQTNN